MKDILKTASMVAAMAPVFGNTPAEINAWKKRMLSTIPGIDFPQDWEQLSESEMAKRLDKAIAFGKGDGNGK